MNILNDGIAFGVSSLGCPLIAIDLDENPITGSTPDSIKNLLVEVFDIPNNKEKGVNGVDEVIKSHIAYCSSGKNKGSDALPVYMSYLTSLVHEMRHYHDLISSTTGFRNIFFSISQYFNTPSVFYSILNAYRDGIIDIITIPFNTSSISNESIGELRVQELEYYFDRVKKVNTNNLKNWSLDFPKLTSATLGTLYETSAINHQIGFAYDLIGNKGRDLILDLFNSTERGKQYLHGVRILQELKLSNSNDFNITSSHLCLLTWYALNGGKLQGKGFGKSISSIVLWELLLTEYSKKENNKSSLESVLGMCNDVFNSWGLTDLNTTVIEWDDVIEQMSEALIRETKIVNIDFSIHQSGLNDFQKIINDRKYIINLISKNMNLFFDPQVYGWGVILGTYPIPTIALKCNGIITYIDNVKNREFNIVNEFFFWEIVHTLLSKGRGYSCPFLEDHVFNILKKDGEISFWMN